MSLDIFYFSYIDGKPVPFSIDIVIDALGRFADRGERTCWALTFPDGGWSDLYLDDANEISDFCLNRPALSPELWQGVFEIMRRTSGILVCTGAGACVTDASIISRIDFTDAVSPIYVVDDATGIRARIEAAMGIFSRYMNYIRRRANGPSE